MSSARLRWAPLLYYSSGHFVLAALYGFDGSFLLKFYADFTPLSAAWIGTAVLLRSLVDVAVDPAIGWLSDRTTLSPGRRRPYFLLGTIPAVVLFYLLFCPPAGSERLVFAHLLITSILLMVFLSMMGITHLAFAFEMTPDYNERTRIFGLKNFVENISTIIALFSVPAVLGLADAGWFGPAVSRADCYRMAVIGLGVLAVAAAAIAYAGTSEQPVPAPVRYGFWRGVAETLQNRAFRVLLIVMALLITADRVTMSQLFILLEQFHGKKEEEAGAMLAGYLGGGLLSVWLWVWLAHRFGKANILRTAIAFWPLTWGAFVVQRWSDAGLFFVAAAMGIVGTGVITTLGAMGPDVLEHARDRGNARQEGMYVSLGNVVFQIAVGVGVLLGGVGLQIAGYEGGGAATSRVVDTLRLVYVAGPTILAGAALVVFGRSLFDRRPDEAADKAGERVETG